MKTISKKMNYLVLALVPLLVIAIFTTLSFQNSQVIKNQHSGAAGKAELFVKGLLKPQGLALNKRGKLFTQSAYDGKISIINKDGKALDYTYLDNYNGYGIEIDRNDNILMASGSRVLRVDSFGRMIQSYDGFKKAYDVEIAPDDTIFVSDSQANKIYKISFSGEKSELVSFAGRSSRSVPNAAGIHFDKDFKNLYCVNMYTGDLYKISLNKDYQAVETTVIASNLKSPNFLDIDTEDNIYVTCLGDNSVVRIDQNSIVETIDTNGKLAVPSGIVFDGSSNNENSLYVASKESNSIYKINIGIKNKVKK